MSSNFFLYSSYKKNPPNYPVIHPNCIKKILHINENIYEGVLQINHDS